MDVNCPALSETVIDEVYRLGNVFILRMYKISKRHIQPSFDVEGKRFF
jgi:hypothetical protein